MLTVSQISTYTLNIVGHDAQYRCANVMHVEPAYNWPTEYQAHFASIELSSGRRWSSCGYSQRTRTKRSTKHHMVSKASSMFAAFQSLKEAQDEVDASVSREDMAMSAFGICRRRVRFTEKISSAKMQARERTEPDSR